MRGEGSEEDDGICDDWEGGERDEGEDGCRRELKLFIDQTSAREDKK